MSGFRAPMAEAEADAGAVGVCDRLRIAWLALRWVVAVWIAPDIEP